MQIVYSRKKQNYRDSEKGLLKTLNHDLELDIKDLQIYNTYIINSISEDLLELGKSYIFSEPEVDEIFESIDNEKDQNKHSFTIKLLDAQYDNKADWAMQLFGILQPSLNKSEIPKIKTGTTYIFSFDNNSYYEQKIEKIKHYLVNEVDSEVIDLSQYQFSNMEDNISSNITLEEQIKDLSMDNDDLEFIKKYYKDNNKEMNALELKVLDTYWSDHCRHTTFNTELDIFAKGAFKEHLDFYLNQRKVLGRENKPLTLMDLATITTKWIKYNNPKRCENIDVSDEINACSIKTKVNGEDYIVMFKNETHNHPTEIEPFGGAATCLGGAIRDPLSGRTFVYQAMRISGASDPRTELKDTIKGKLPQKRICQEAAHGYSSYGNQIGLATGFVDEIYHSGYEAKRLECGALIGAAPATNIRREKPLDGDCVILLGGMTGRDGIGGATGSSKTLNKDSVKSQASEVQKGNPIVERKIQKLFRNPNVTKLIKKCNDFGAGGVSVAIGELADSLEIYLDKVPLKYQGLSPLEIAVSESQERMAVIIDPKDINEFEKLANEENLNSYNVGNVTNSGKLVMKYHGLTVLDLERNFIDTNGAPKKASASISAAAAPFPKYSSIDEIINDINISYKTGLVEKFDSSIGSLNLTHPFGGKYQATKTDAMISKIFVSPNDDKDSDRASIMTYGFDVELMNTHPFSGGKSAINSAVAKSIAAGAKLEDLFLTLQEYFPKPIDSESWGQPLKALLGANKQASDLQIPIIGGKDSMSGNFHDKKVPNTLIAFIGGTLPVSKVKSNEFKQVRSYIYLVENFDDMPKDYLSAKAIDKGGIAEAVIKSSMGNKIGFDLDKDFKGDIFDKLYGSILIESEVELSNLTLVGKTNESDTVLDFTFDKFEPIISNLNDIYPSSRVSSSRRQSEGNIDD